ncbi:AAA family ATPase [Shewanella corallii]|uniref:AAA family ATPase n=1 Tax=Shewanella corallii TaxID=560080 RepID=A0ABT0N8X2_9GAMM|nr:AAA family ATPase [Shewanella corallii]MCL2914906.1 AAA family ATPase [Shewanella corallii]
MFKNVKSIKNFGIFKNVNTNAGLPFYQFNLFYGFNYSGKTTLSRIFRAMQLGEMPEGFTGASFEVDCHDAGSIKSNNLQKVENLRVFNSDYIAKNVNFDESSVSPVLIVGERNIELETELQALEDSIPAKEAERDQNIGFAASKEKEKNNRLTEVGRNVAVLSILGRSTFNASSVRTMLASAEASHDLTPEQVSAYIDTARATAASSVPIVKFSVPDMIGVFGDIDSIMATSVTQATIAELDADNRLRSWVEEGIERNAGHTTCQFCGNTLSQARIDELNAYFSKAYKDLSRRIDTAIASVQSQSFASSIPDTSQLYPDLQKNFDELRSQIQPIHNSVGELKASLVKLLTDKKEHMGEVLPFNASDYHLPLVTGLIEQFNAVITEHNERAANHSTEQRQAIEAIKRHYVYQETQNYDHPQTQLDIQAFKDASVTIQDEINANKARIDAIKAELNNTRQGAQSLNDNLRQYFGKTDIEIKPVDGTYKFMREDREAKHLSDGERTAIAFAYFITQLEDESLNGTKPIVYLDDPICSLDSNHIYNVLGIIKNKLGHEHVEQLFISMHNFEFFNLVKTWLSYFSKTKTGIAKRAQFFLVNRTRDQSKIDPLPKLLKDHRSEYAYLISKVKEAVERPEHCDSVAVQSYLRKILEVYFSFRFNLTEFRANGKDQIAPNLLKGIEDAEVKANMLYEYMNEKCHAKSMELGVKFPEAVQPQLTNAWGIITNAIETNDKPHYDAYYA